MHKNAAGQSISAALISKTDGSPVTTGTTTVYVTGDNGTQAAGGGTVAHKGNGEWSYAPTQAETNYDKITFTFVNSSAVLVAVNVSTVAVGLDGYLRVDVGAYAGVEVNDDFADFQGALTAATATTLTGKAGTTFPLNALQLRYVEITSGDGRSQVAIITGNTADDPPVLTLDRTLAVVPAVGNAYRIGGPADVRLTPEGLDAVDPTEPTVTDDGAMSTWNFRKLLRWGVSALANATRTIDQGTGQLTVKTLSGATSTTQSITDDGKGNEVLGAPQ